MKIGVPLKTLAGESRVAVTPETAKKLQAQGHVIHVQSGAGVAASATDAAYAAAGAEITDAVGAFGCDLVLKVRSPSSAELLMMKSGAALVGMLNPLRQGRSRAPGRRGLDELRARSRAASRRQRHQASRWPYGHRSNQRLDFAGWRGRIKCVVKARVVVGDVSSVQSVIQCHRAVARSPAIGFTGSRSRCSPRRLAPQVRQT